MRTTLVTIVVMCALGAAPAAAESRGGDVGPQWSKTHRVQYRALKQQVRREYRALKQIKRQRPLSTVEQQRYDALRNAREHFTSAGINRAAGYGSVGLAGGLMGAAFLTRAGGAGQYVARLGMTSVCSLGLSMGVGYSMFLESKRQSARGVAQAQQAGIQPPLELRTMARRTLLQEARAKRDAARVMAQPSLAIAAKVQEMADSLR
jgi:hypothetical protein